MDKETADKVRGMVRRVTLKNTSDDGQTQRASIETAEGIWHDDVEILQAYGVASHAPEDGAVGIAIAVGGDQGDVVVLPVGNPSQRLGGLPPGAVAIYNGRGDRVVAYPDGRIDIQAGASVTTTVGGVSMTVSAAGVAIVGGTVTHNGRDIGDTHRHVDVVAGPDLTGPPQP